MKFKAVFMINTSGGGNPDGVASHSFFTRSQCEQACTAWSEAIDRQAYMWDGDTWTFYS